jgi:phosphatidylserine/phosphatidylglycerophosphate/cardiolipin synthase-like enzyme
MPPFTAVALQRVLSPSSAQQLAIDLQRFADSGFSPEQIATALELILADRKLRPGTDDCITLVTTGPEAAGVTNRDTSVVVREVFANADSSVLLAGYAVYHGQRVFHALAERMQARPELSVKFFLDIQRPRGDSTAESELVRRFADRFKNREWPTGYSIPLVYYFPRSLDLQPEKRASLHAKCIVVDTRTVFVSSANFTEAAQERNIEVGLLIQSHQVAAQLAEHFDALISDGLVKSVF